jgi:hypothetical protein
MPPANPVLSTAQLAHQPGSGELPITHDSLCRDVEHIGRLFDAETAEESELNDVCAARIQTREGFQRIVERTELNGAIPSAGLNAIQF